MDRVCSICMLTVQDNGLSGYVLCSSIHRLLCQVNMSIAILPMSAEYGWSPATVGLIQSSFFWGYLLTQVFFSSLHLFHLPLQSHILE
jgi:hypothetical protein